MAIGLHIEVNHRMGGHGGLPSEWEIHSASTEVWQRMRDLLTVLQPIVTSETLTLDDDRYARGFTLKEGVREDLVSYLTERLVTWDWEPEATRQGLRRRLHRLPPKRVHRSEGT